MHKLEQTQSEQTKLEQNPSEHTQLEQNPSEQTQFKQTQFEQTQFEQTESVEQTKLEQTAQLLQTQLEQTQFEQTQLEQTAQLVQSRRLELNQLEKELFVLKKRLELKKLEKELSELKKQNAIYETQKNDLDQNISKVTVQITENINKQKECKNHFLIEEISNECKTIEHFDLLSSNELKVIINGMDKTKYPTCNKSRWLDLSKIINCVIEMKKQYNRWELNDLKLKFSQETYPPCNYYSYTFTDGRHNFKF